jgi:hypothetical protein
MRYLAQLLVEQGYVRPDLTQIEVGDILSLPTDFATVDQLKMRAGRSPTEIGRRVHILALSLLT